MPYDSSFHPNPYAASRRNPVVPAARAVALEMDSEDQGVRFGRSIATGLALEIVMGLCLYGAWQLFHLIH